MKNLKFLAACIGILVLFLAVPALAGNPPLLTLSSVTSPGTFVPGSVVQVNGTYFGHNKIYNIWFDDSLLPNIVKSDKHGNFSMNFQVPFSITQGTYLVVATATKKNKRKAQAALTVLGPAYLATLSPNNGDPGLTTVTITGYQYGASEPVDVYFDSDSDKVLDGISTAANGTFSGTFVVPATADVGSHTVIAVGQTSNRSANQTFTIGNTASISLPTSSGVPGTEVLVNGLHFAPYENVTIQFDNHDVGIISGGTTNNIGTLLGARFVVPLSTPQGVHTVNVVGLESQRSAQANFTVTGPAAITISPTFGPPGTVITVHGTQFGAHEAVNILFDGVLVGVGTPDGAGEFYKDITVPINTGIGYHEVAGVGQSTGRAADAPGGGFQVPASSAATISFVGPDHGLPGAQVTIHLANFAPNEAVTIRFDTNYVAQTTTDATGARDMNFVVPIDAIPGVHSVNAVAQPSGESAQAPFTVDGGTAITLTPASGNAGIPVTVDGSNFGDNEVVFVFFDGVKVTQGTTNATTGSFTGSVFVVPATATTGAHTVTGVGQSSGRSDTKIYTVGAGPVIGLTPASGDPGIQVTVANTSGHYAPNEAVTILFDTNNVNQGTADASGDISIPFVVPMNALAGNHTVNAVGQLSGKSAQHNFAVDGPATLTITVPATKDGATNTAVTVVGAAYGVNEDVAIFFDTQQVAVGHADGSSAFTQTFLVPAVSALGAHKVSAVGQLSGRAAQDIFTVTATAGIVLTPTFGPPSTTVTVTGTYFLHDEWVDIFFDKIDVRLVHADSVGAFTATFVVPADTTPGTHWVTAIGQISALNAQASFVVCTDWPQFHYGPRHSGYNGFENVINPGNVGSLGQAWTGATTAPIESSPVAANIVLPDASVTEAVYVGSWDAGLYAFSAADGSLLPSWTFNPAFFLSGIVGAPAYHNGQVFAADTSGLVAALPAATGIPANWVGFTFPVWTSPVVANGIVYVADSAGLIWGFDEVTGLPAAPGLFPLFVNFGFPLFSSPAVNNGILYVGSTDGNLYAFNAATGATLWVQPTLLGNWIVDAPAVANGIVYVGDLDGFVYAFNAINGSFVWLNITFGPIYSSPAVANGIVYIGSDDTALYAFDAPTGGFITFIPTGLWVDSSPAVANGVVYVGSEDGNLYAFDQFLTTYLFTATTGGPIAFSSPAVANGMVYVGSLDGLVHAYSLPGGSSLAAKAPVGPPDPKTLVPDPSLKKK